MIRLLVSKQDAPQGPSLQSRAFASGEKFLIFFLIYQNDKGVFIHLKDIKSIGFYGIIEKIIRIVCG